MWWGLKEGMVEIAPYGARRCRPTCAKAADATKAAIIAGTLHPFTGPVKATEGVERLIAQGQHASDEQLQKMDWYVKGVQS